MTLDELRQVFERGAFPSDGICAFPSDGICEHSNMMAEVYRKGLAAVLERLAQEYDRLNYHECGKGWTPRWLRCIKDGLNVDAEPDIEAAKEALAGARRLADDGSASYKAMKLALDAVYDALNGGKR